MTARYIQLKLNILLGMLALALIFVVFGFVRSLQAQTPGPDPEVEQCVSDALGAARFAELKAGGQPTNDDIAKASHCFPGAPGERGGAVELDAEVLACLEQKLGTERFNALMAGEEPSVRDKAKASVCFAGTEGGPPALDEAAVECLIGILGEERFEELGRPGARPTPQEMRLTSQCFPGGPPGGPPPLPPEQEQCVKDALGEDRFFEIGATGPTPEDMRKAAHCFASEHGGMDEETAKCLVEQVGEEAFNEISRGVRPPTDDEIVKGNICFGGKGPGPLPDQQTMKCLAEKLGEERFNALMRGGAPSPDDMLKAQECFVAGMPGGPPDVGMPEGPRVRPGARRGPGGSPQMDPTVTACIREAIGDEKFGKLMAGGRPAVEDEILMGGCFGGPPPGEVGVEGGEEHTGGHDPQVELCVLDAVGPERHNALMRGSQPKPEEMLKLGQCFGDGAPSAGPPGEFPGAGEFRGTPGEFPGGPGGASGTQPSGMPSAPSQGGVDDATLACIKDVLGEQRFKKLAFGGALTKDEEAQLGTECLGAGRYDTGHPDTGRPESTVPHSIPEDMSGLPTGFTPPTVMSTSTPPAGFTPPTGLHPDATGHMGPQPSGTTGTTQPTTQEPTTTSQPTFTQPSGDHSSGGHTGSGGH